MPDTRTRTTRPRGSSYTGLRTLDCFSHRPIPRCCIHRYGPSGLVPGAQPTGRRRTNTCLGRRTRGDHGDRRLRGPDGSGRGRPAFAVQMVVAGVALRATIDTWVAAPAADKQAAFYVADSVRWIEKGLSGFFNILNGVTLVARGIGTRTGRARCR